MTTRTYGWYVLHSPRTGHKDEWYENDPDARYANAPSPRVHLEHFQKLGLLDTVPTFDNFVPLLDQYMEWYKRVDENWNIFTQEEKAKGLMVTLHWTLSHVLCDPNIDVKILEYVYQKYLSKFAITLVYNASFPERLLREMIENTGKKTDPTKGTKGGEITCFVLHNKYISGDIVDLCARKTKKVTIQRDCVGHPNVKRETLVYLAKEGKNENVKKDARNALIEKGFVTI